MKIKERYIKMIKKIILITILLVLVGCKKAEEPRVEITTKQPAETIADISINSDISEIDSLDKDLDAGELENLEVEIDEINW